MAGQADRAGMLRPSFVPPPEIRRLREFTRLRADLVGAGSLLPSSKISGLVKP